MKFLLFKYTCKQCGTTYKAPELGPDSYGEFLMRSRSGETVYLNAIADPIYTEVDGLLKKISSVAGLSSVERANIQRKVFGEACDTDSHGNRYSIAIRPKCESCGCCVPSYWEATEPPEYVDLEFSSVTHKEWFSLSEHEKVRRLENAILS